MLGVGRRAGNEDRFSTENRESKDLRLVNSVFHFSPSETIVKTSQSYYLILTKNNSLRTLTMNIC